MNRIMIGFATENNIINLIPLLQLKLKKLGANIHVEK